MTDIYRIQIDTQKKACYTCKKENNCKLRALTERGVCNYSMKPEARKIINKIKPL